MKSLHRKKIQYKVIVPHPLRRLAIYFFEIFPYSKVQNSISELWKSKAKVYKRKEFVNAHVVCTMNFIRVLKFESDKFLP